MVSIWKKVAERIQKNRSVLAEGVQQVFSSGTKLDEDLPEQLEEVLIRSDVGLETSAHVIARPRALARERGVILAVAHLIGVPVRYVGLGEGIEDLEEFDPAEFARALVEPVG